MVRADAFQVYIFIVYFKEENKGGFVLGVRGVQRRFLKSGESNERY